MSAPESPRQQALRYVANERFHQHFTLPATADHDALTVSFAEIGRVPDPGDSPSPPLPVVLFMPGMFASRYVGIFVHAVADKLGVRVLVVDRPGIGDSTNVPIERRIAVWVELVPQLLRHVGVEHVALVSHSAGTIYLLNTLYHCRNILHPERPFVALAAPWVDPAHSGVTAMQMAQYIPTKAFGAWNLIPRFFNLNIRPVIASSGATLTSVSSVLPSLGGGGDQPDGSQQTNNRNRLEMEYGLSCELQAELEPLVFRTMFESNTVGANSEAAQCLRKSPSGTWGVCEEYGEFVWDLVGLERERRAVGGAVAQGKLRIETYFAESDSMIGKKGQKYVEECWKGKQDGDFDNVWDYATTTVGDVNHDTLIMSAQVWENIFSHVNKP